MSLRRVVISGALVCVGIITAASGQTAQVPVREDVMRHIPHDALGFVVARSVRSATDTADEFLEKTGISEQAEEVLGEGVLEAIASELTLGEGFDADGGFAVVLLNPEPLGIDVEKEISRAIAQSTISSMPGMAGVLDTIFDRWPSSQPSMPQVPYAMLLPGSDVQSVLPAAKVSQGADGTTLSFAGVEQEFHAASLGQYVVVSPLAVAVEAVSEARSRPVELTGGHAELLETSEVVAWVDVEGIRNALGGLLEKIEQMEAPSDATTAPTTQAKDFMEGLASLKEPSLIGPSMLDTFKQVRQITAGVYVTELGPRVEAVVEYNPDSEYAAARATRGVPGALLDRLPDMPYMMALGCTTQQWSPEITRQRLEHYINKLEEVDEETRAELAEAGAELIGQVKSVQFVWGAAPEGHMSGAFGFAGVLECDDSQQVRSLLARLSEAGNQALTQAAGNEEDIPELKITHSADTETVDETSVDMLTLAQHSQDGMGMMMPMQMLLGSPDVNIRIAAADETHLVLTAGGAEVMLSEALARARAADGPIAAREEVEQLLGETRGRTQAVMLFNAGTYLQLMMRMFGGMGMTPPAIVEDFTEQPVTVVASEDDGLDRVVFHVPTQMVSDIVTFTKEMEQMYSSPSESGPPPDAEDF